MAFKQNFVISTVTIYRCLYLTVTKENTASPVAKTSSENKKMNLYRSNGVPPAYSDMAEEVQRGREAKIAHLLKQVGKNRNDLLL